MTEGEPQLISSDELALRLGVDRPRVEQLATIGALKPDADHMFDAVFAPDFFF